MADDETAPGIPVLSAFDKLKLSSNNNYNNIQRKKNNCSNSNSDGNLENPLSINKDSTLVVHQKVPTSTSVISVSSQTSAVSILAATESLKCEKSISLPLAQCEYNNKTLMMFGNCKVSTMFASGDVCENPSASGDFSVFTTPSTPPSTSNQLDNVLTSKSITKSEQEVQNRYENERISSTPASVSLSQSNQSSSISSSLSSTSRSLSLSLSSSLTSSLPSLQSLSSSLASITMALPNSVNGKNIDVLPSSCPPPDQNVDIKSKKIDSNKISVKTVKSGKFKASSSSLTSLSSSSSSLSLAVATTTSNMQLRPKNIPIVCAPPVMVSVDQKNNKSSASSNKVKNQHFCFPMHPGTTNIDAASLKNLTKQNSSNLDNSKKRQSSSNNDRNEQQTTVEDKNNKKKRCSDRYDSSESSDSGVATSLSCTDSSTASSDASDAGSPYSPVLLGDESHHRSNMPPQTILATTNGNAANSPATGAVTPVQNILKSGKQQQKQQNQSQNKDITSLPQQKQGQVASQLQKVSKHLWSWTSLNNCEEGGHFSEISNSAKTNVTAPNNKSNNKRHSQPSITPIDGGPKKTRTTSNHILENGVNGNSGQLPLSSQSNKRLKVAAMEESQTKITGYFKSQMKAQIHQNGLKKDTINTILPSSSKSTPLSASTKAIVSLSPTSMSSNNVVSTTTTSTGCCLNKYFNLLSSQMRENQERISNPSSNLNSLPVPLKKIERSKPTKIAQVAPNPRKITTASPHSSQIIEKSPKKHVAIAPRTADIRQRHEQSLSSSIKGSVTTPQQQQQQPAVLLTAIRIPQPNQPPQLVPTSPQQQVTVTNVITSKAQQNVASAAAVAAKIPTGPSLYQIPMMPNLVQFPNLITANVSQLTAARGNTPTSTTQYFLNGTVFKFQQIPTTSTEINLPAFSIENGNESTNMTAATAGTAIKQHASNTKNTSAMTTASFQEMLSNQFQAQQQQAAAQNHRLHSSQPIFMATTTGLLLNAASLPTMLSSNKQTMAIQSQQIPALQPIPGATQMMPGLSSIFSPSQEVSTQQLQQLKSEQVGLDALHHTHIPPLSVPSSAFSKLAIVKTGAAFTQSMRQVSSTQPPPLVTISSASQNVNINTKASGNGPSISTRPYQKKYAELESKTKTTTQNNNTELAIGAPIPFSPKIPTPTLACPPLVAYKEEQRRTEDIFDLLKNSKNETTPTPLSRLSQESKEEDFDTICVQLSSSMLLPETTSNTTVSSESFQLDDSPPSSINNTLVLECSLTSTPSITSESPELTIDLKGKETEMAENISETSSPDSTDIALSPTIDTTLAESDILQKSAISPILSQPKTIRFPAKHESNFHFGPKGMRRHDGVCHWDKCDKKHESSSKLLDHMQTHHVNTQIGPFACLWLGCKVYGRESCSRRWLERHVLSHGGTKPFKCIVDGCGLRFGSQLALQKHVNGHFTATENKDSTSKRTSDPPVPKLLRKNGKKLRYRRQPFSARMFDFFDAGIMEGLQHRLRQINTLTNGDNSITFKGEIIMRRKNVKGIVECYVQWAPPKIISNEWLPDSGKPFLKTLSINRMQPNEKTNIESLLRSAYLMPHSPNLFQSFHLLNGQTQQNYTTSYTNSQSNAIKEDTTDGTSLSSSIKNSSLSSISNLLLKSPQIELRQKQSRKPPKRIQPS